MCSDGKKRSITIITPFYNPETNAAAKRAQAIANIFYANKWDTRVITQLPNYPQGRLYPGFDNKKLVISEGNITITRLKPVIVPKNKLLMRLFAEFSFIIKAFLISIKNRTDVIYVSSPYMFNGWVLLFVKLFNKVAIVWEVRDLTWLYASAVHRDQFGFGKQIEKLMFYTAEKVDAVFTTTLGQAQYFMQNIRVRNIKIYPNGISREHFNLVSNAVAYPKTKFTLVYAGLIGYPQGLVTLIEAAESLTDVDFILIGDGVEKNNLEKLVKQKNLANVDFKGYLSFELVTRYYQTADILYAQLLKNPVFAKTHPSKIWEYMAAGKPIIYGGEGDTALSVKNSGAGVVIAPEDPKQLVQAIKMFKENQALRVRMGIAGRCYVSQYHMREDLFLHLVQDVQDCWEQFQKEALQ